VYVYRLLALSLLTLIFSFADYLADLVIWVEVEPAMGIISACLPTLRPILTYLFRKVGLSQDASERVDTPGKSIITFGRAGVRHKASGYSVGASIDQDQGSMTHLSGWPEEQHGKRNATVSVGPTDVELNHLEPNQTQSINVKTEIAWNEFHAKKGKEIREER
jgi:hypothetical protein